MRNFAASPMSGAVTDLTPGVLTPVNDDGGLTIFPSVIPLANGGYVMTWTQINLSVDSVPFVRMQVYDADGSAVSEPIDVVSDNGPVELCAMVELSDGGFVLAYSGDSDSDPDATDFDMYVQRYDADLTPVGLPILINSLTEGDQMFPTLAALPGGGFVITWTSTDDGVTETPCLYMRQFDGDGNPVTAIQGITEMPGGMTSAQIVTLGDGGYLVLWPVTGHNAVVSVAGQRFDEHGAAINGPQTLLDGLAGEAFSFFGLGSALSAIATADGGYMLTWNTTGTGDTGTDIYFQHFDADGTPTSAVIQVNEDAGDQYSQVVAVLADDSTVVAWAEQPGPDGLIVRVQRFDSDNLALGDATEILVENGLIIIGTAITALSDGGFVVAVTTLSMGEAGMGFQILQDVFSAGGDPVTLTGTAGNDTFVVRNTGDTIIELRNQGSDTVRTGLSHYILGANIENLSYTGWGDFTGYGNTAANVITARSGDDTLDGKRGADTMTGGAGDDTYYVDNIGDSVVELAGKGGDTVITTLAAYTLDNNFENLIYHGSLAFTGGGNSLNNVIAGSLGNDTLTGGDGNDVLVGRAGDDSLSGGNGDDLYYVDALGDTTIEADNGGTDLVRSTVSFELAAYVENLILGGTANIDGTGNDLDNKIGGNGGNNHLYGRAGDDVLNGGAGNDTMVGGEGDDKYHVDSTDDVVIEGQDQGYDTVRASASFSLGDHIEALILSGSDAIWGTGNTLANAITGNSGSNQLNGGLGNDTLNGGDGDDSLTGGAGADLMAGGFGNDAYYVDNLSDKVREGVGAGTDTVFSSVSLSLSANVERLFLTGTDNIDGTGNRLDNTLTGNGGDNRLTGGLGADLFVFHAGGGHDVITDFHSGQGDTIQMDSDAPGVITQVGNDAVITLAGGQTVTVLNTVATDAGFLSHLTYVS